MNTHACVRTHVCIFLYCVCAWLGFFKRKRPGEDKQVIVEGEGTAADEGEGTATEEDGGAGP